MTAFHWAVTEAVERRLHTAQPSLNSQIRDLAQMDHNPAAARDAAAGLLSTAADQVQGPTGTATTPHRS